MNRPQSFFGGSGHGRDPAISATITVAAAIAAMAAPTETTAAFVAIAVAVAPDLDLPCRKVRRAPQPGTAGEAPMFERGEFWRRAVPGEGRRAPMGAAHRRASGTNGFTRAIHGARPSGRLRRSALLLQRSGYFCQNKSDSRASAKALDLACCFHSHGGVCRKVEKTS